MYLKEKKSLNSQIVSKQRLLIYDLVYLNVFIECVIVFSLHNFFRLVLLAKHKA